MPRAVIVGNGSTITSTSNLQPKVATIGEEVVVTASVAKSKSGPAAADPAIIRISVGTTKRRDPRARRPDPGLAATDDQHDTKRLMGTSANVSIALRVSA